jgi:tetratricopeptide (TPR) repeat protein/TolB-like protein
LFAQGATCFGAEPGARAPALAVVGIVNRPDKQVDPKTAASFIALLEVELSGRAELKLVERQLRDTLLKQQQLSLTALADAKSPLRLGRLLGADLIVWGEATSDGAEPALLMRVVEAKTGVVRCVSSVSLSEKNLLPGAGDIARRIATIASSSKPPVATVAVGVFENAGQFERLRPLAFLLRDRMTEELERRPSILVMQRSAMQPLIEELELARSGLVEGAPAGNVLPPREATYLLTGSFDDVVGSVPQRVRARMQLISAASGKIVASDQVEVTVGELEDVCAKWTESIERQAATKGEAARVTPRAAQSEGETLKRRALTHLSRTHVFIQVPTVELPRARFGEQAMLGQVTNTLLARQALEELEALLFLKPDDLVVKALLAGAYQIDEPSVSQPDRAISLYREIEGADAGGVFGIDAQRKLPRAYAAAARKSQLQHLADAAERARACVAAYAKLSEQSAARDLDESMAATSEAANWSYNEPLNDFDGAMRFFRANLEQAMTADISKLPPRSLALTHAAGSFSWVVWRQPERADECREQLRKLSGHPSPKLAYLGMLNLGQLEERMKNYKVAADYFVAAVKVCQGQQDRWFNGREVTARTGAASAYLKAKDLTAGFAVLQPQIDKVKAGGFLEEETCLALGGLYEASGQYDQAIALYRPLVQRYPNGVGFVADRLRALEHTHPQATTRPGAVTYEVRQKGAANMICAGEGMIWTCNRYIVRWFDPASGQSGQVHQMSNRPLARSLAWTNHALWVATNGEGLWRLDTSGDLRSLSKGEPWTRIAGLPDTNITSMVAGDDGDLYVGVGVATPGEGAAVKGGVVRIDAQGTVHALNQLNAPRLAPDRMVWQRGMLWVKAQNGLSRLDVKAGTWKSLYPGRTMHLSAGTDRILLIEWAKRVETARWTRADTSGVDGELEEITSGGLLPELAVESPDWFWFAGRAGGVVAGRELQCFEKRTGRLMQIDEAVGPPFTSVNGMVWFGDRLWIATTSGLVAVSKVRFPATAPATHPVETTKLPAR